MTAPNLMAVDFAMLEQNAERACALLRTIGSKWRLLVVCQLVVGERTVTELEHITGLSQSALSQHLMVLRHRELVTTRRVAQNVYYALNSAVITDILVTLHKHFCEEDISPAVRRLPTKKSPRLPKGQKPLRQNAANLAYKAKSLPKAARH